MPLPHWIFCPHCGSRRDTSNRYTSPANAERDSHDWADEHESRQCVAPVRRSLTDTDIVDAIALGLGTRSSWSGADELEWIADTIAQVREHPGDVEPTDYLERWSQKYSLDPVVSDFLTQYVSEEALENSNQQHVTEIEALLDTEVVYTCVDCDSGGLTKDGARWHAEHEGHCVVELTGGTEDDEPRRGSRPPGSDLLGR